LKEQQSSRCESVTDSYADDYIVVKPSQDDQLSFGGDHALATQTMSKYFKNKQFTNDSSSSGSKAYQKQQGAIYRRRGGDPVK